MTLLDAIASNAEFKKKVREAAARSRESGREIGFPICLRDGELVAGEEEMTKGNESSTKVVQSCPLTGGEFAGSFHSHPSNSPYPSRMDILSAGTRENVFCTAQEERMYCMQRRSGTGPREIAETVERLSYFEFAGQIPEQHFKDVVSKHYELREISLKEESS